MGQREEPEPTEPLLSPAAVLRAGPDAPGLVVSSTAEDADSAYLATVLEAEIGLRPAIVPARPEAVAEGSGGAWVVDVGSIPEEEGRDRITTMLERRLAGLVGDLPAQTRTCVTTSPGTQVDLTPLRDLLQSPPPGYDPATPLSLLIAPNWKDRLVLDVFGWANRTPPVDVARISLATGVSWDKEILTWTICPPHERRRITKTGGPGLDGTLTLSPADGEDALVFRKPGFLGAWFDVFYFDMSAVTELLGGRFARFTWYRD